MEKTVDLKSILSILDGMKNLDSCASISDNLDRECYDYGYDVGYSAGYSDAIDKIIYLLK